jgi:hypothetical protein
MNSDGMEENVSTTEDDGPDVSCDTIGIYLTLMVHCCTLYSLL